MNNKGEVKTDNDLRKRAGLSREEKREVALDLHLHTYYTQKEICKIVGWTEKTFTLNKQKYNWNTLKETTEKIPEIVLTNLYKILEKITKKALDDDTDKYYAKDLAMIAGAIEKQEKRITHLSTYTQACQFFVDWLKPIDLETAQLFSKLYTEFVGDLVNQQPKPHNNA